MSTENQVATMQCLARSESTASSCSSPSTPPLDVAAAFFDLRRLSGLGEDQLAQLFDVSKQDMYFWESGRSLPPQQESRLRHILDVVRRIDRGSSEENKKLLLGTQNGDKTPFSLLREGNYDHVVSVLSKGPGRQPFPKTPITKNVPGLTRPMYSPDVYLSSLENRPCPACGPVLSFAPLCTAKRK